MNYIKLYILYTICTAYFAVQSILPLRLKELNIPTKDLKTWIGIEIWYE